MSFQLTRTASSCSVFSDASDRTRAPDDERIGLKNPSLDDTDREVSDVESESSCSSSASTGTQAPVECPMDTFVETCGKASTCWRKISMGLILSLKAHRGLVSYQEGELLILRVCQFSQMFGDEKNTEVVQLLFNAVEKLNDALNPETDCAAKKSVEALMMRCISSLQAAHQERASLANRVTVNPPPAPTVARVTVNPPPALTVGSVVFALFYLFSIIWIVKESLGWYRGESDAFALIPSLFNSYKEYIKTT